MRTLGSLLYLFGAGVLAVLWARGYLTDAIGKIVADVQAPPAKRAFIIGGQGTGGGRVLRT